MQEWKRAVLDAEWSSYEPVGAVKGLLYGHEGLVIFDIKGNVFRLIAIA